MSPAYLSASTYLTPRDLSEQVRHGEIPHATLHVTFDHGKGKRTVQVPLARRDLLAVIANAADALRLLDEHAGEAS